MVSVGLIILVVCVCLFVWWLVESNKQTYYRTLDKRAAKYAMDELNKLLKGDTAQSLIPDLSNLSIKKISEKSWVVSFEGIEDISKEEFSRVNFKGWPHSFYTFQSSKEGGGYPQNLFTRMHHSHPTFGIGSGLMFSVRDGFHKELRKQPMFRWIRHNNKYHYIHNSQDLLRGM